MENEILEHKCPSCGGKLEFNTKGQNLKCPYCDTEFDIDSIKELENSSLDGKEDEFDWKSESSNEWSEDEGMSVYSCRSCGGEIVCEQTAAASFCPYCGNPVVFTRNLSGELRPDLVIPFKLDKEAAKAGFHKHLSGKKLLPKVFKDETRIDEIRGVYVPFWLFDTDADAAIRYRATRTHFWSDINYNYTRTMHYALIREGSLSFDNVPVDGSLKLDDTLMESIEPYDFSEAVDFKTAYLSGFLADKYDVDASESRSRANERIKRSTEDAFRSTTVGYATVVPERSYVKTSSGRIRYALLPVWLMTKSWKDKRYTFAMNGQTGKFVGDLPMDMKAFLRYLGLWFGTISAAAMALLYLIHLM